MLHLDVDRVPPISHIPSTAANELPSVIGDATFLQIFCHSIPRRLPLNCRTGDAKRLANFGQIYRAASLLRRGTAWSRAKADNPDSASFRLESADFLEIALKYSSRICYRFAEHYRANREAD